MKLWLFAVALAIPTILCSSESPYLLGLGIADVTGPFVEVGMMGYANSQQRGTGLYQRQRARAFIVAEAAHPENRVVIINADICMGDSAITRGVLERLNDLYPGVYNEKNVALGGTHSHSGPAGYLENLLPTLTTLGFVAETYDAIVNGAVLSVIRAHESLAPGSIGIANTTLLNASANRSPTAYLTNPPEERALYEHDVDKEFTLLRFNDAAGSARGLLSFFSVHGTSLYRNNTLISGDNKGYASQQTESWYDPALPGNNTFVASFAQSSVGDTTPNTLGTYCESPGMPYDGQPCGGEQSLCGQDSTGCIGRGPGFRESDFASNAIIGQAQADTAISMMAGVLEDVSGSVRSTHQYVNMSIYTFPLANGTVVTLCPAALGYAFSAGTTDGPGIPTQHQAENSSSFPVNPPGFNEKPSQKQVDCQYPKPILVNGGENEYPYRWSPNIVAVQLFRIGQVVILSVPTEFTTMAGRRLRKSVKSTMISQGIIDDTSHVIIFGITNGAYSHYATTREEYQQQRYEGASTLYGQFETEAYQGRHFQPGSDASLNTHVVEYGRCLDIYSGLTPYLSDTNNSYPVQGPAPPNLIKDALHLFPAPGPDVAMTNAPFGSTTLDVKPAYSVGETAFATFVGANPRHDLRHEDTFLAVQALDSATASWVTIRTDSSPSTVFNWVSPTNLAFPTSSSNISWTIENNFVPVAPFQYRLAYFGNYKQALTGAIIPFVGTSSVFVVNGQ